MDTFIFILIPVLTFLISGAFSTAGVGAANTLIPVYYSLGIPFSIAAATGLLLNVFSLSSATINHARNHHVNWKLGIILMIPAVVMAPIGAIVGIQTPRQILLTVFLIFLLYTIFSILRSGGGKSKLSITKGAGLLGGIIFGGIAGFLGGLLGVGGGMIILPILTFIETDFKKVAGTSGFVALFISVSGFLSYLAILKSASYVLWIIVIICGVAGGLLGSYLVDRFRSQSIKYLIILIIGAVAARLLYTVLAPIIL